MAQMTIEKDDFGKTVNEPCSGSGRLILQLTKYVKGIIMFRKIWT
jgi:type I restriction enzyme M protein